MKVKLITKSGIIVGYQNEPLDLEKDTIHDINLEDIYIGYSYIDESGNFVSNKEAYDLAMQEQERLAKIEALRAKREPLLRAFDKYKSNVYYGIEVETIEEKQSIIAWYNSILGLEDAALENVPAKIKYYV